jgi:aspartate/methionine/tyrosine aminotransferase
MPGPFAQRAPDPGGANRLTRAVRRRRQRGGLILDLTVSNPTQAGLQPGPAALRALADPASRVYDPQPLGNLAARQAVANDLARRRDAPRRPAATDVVLTASTSEAYSWLFKLLCDPGDHVLVPAPGYPLFTHLAALEGVQALPYPLALRDRWRLEVEEVAARVTPRTRAILLVSPHNPTGWSLSRGEARSLMALAAKHRLVLISDEVFADFQFAGEPGWRDAPLLADEAPAPSLALTRSRGRLISLGGLSKEAGLPQMKVSWIVLGGGSAWKEQASRRLELIADTYLSVAAPQQAALPRWLRGADAFRRRARARLQRNRQAVRRLLRDPGRGQLLPSDGGWCAVLRLPMVRDDEADALALLREEGVLVHPGYYFDLAGGTFLVLSLLTPPAVLDAGLRGLGAYLDRRAARGAPRRQSPATRRRRSR